jgi:Peptidase family M28
MKKRWIWAALCLITTLGIVTGWNWQNLRSYPRVVQTSFERDRLENILPREKTDPDDRSAGAIAAPPIQPDRLWADLTELAVNRYSEDDRSLARNYITQSLRDAGWAPQAQPFDQGINIFAERPGTDPTAGTILIGAHYDTVEPSPGADDNATSVATVLEMARLFGSLPTPRTLQLAFFDKEEAGLLGSFAFVNRLTQPNDLQGAVILEMLGFACYTSGCQHYPVGLPIDPPTDRGDFLAVIGDQGHMPLIQGFEQASQPELPPIVTLPLPLVRFLPPDLLRSDHAPFWQKGIGAVLITDTANFRTPHYHQPSDTLEAIDRPFFNGAAQLVVNAATQLLSGQGSLATEASNPPALEAEPLPRIPL